jgi:chromosome partitioning protein
VNEARSEANGGEVRGAFGSGTGDQRPDPAVATVSRRTSAVVVPQAPPNPADTPIARAAEAAVGVRGGRQPWPRPPRCRIMTIANQKGGVGKTTTTVNLAAALALQGKSACVLDLDPQAHASTHLGIEPDPDRPTLYDVLVNDATVADVRRQVDDNLWIAPADINLAAAEVELAGVVGREVILREKLAVDSESFDYLLMDCGPSLGVLTLNALAAADEVFIPLQPHFLALHGLGKLLETTALVSKRINPTLKVTGIIICLYDSQTKLAQEVVNDLHAFLERSQAQNVPWANAKVFATKIRRNVKLAECPSHGKSVFGYASHCPGAVDYWALAAEVCGVAVPELLVA